MICQKDTVYIQYICYSYVSQCDMSSYIDGQYFGMKYCIFAEPKFTLDSIFLYTKDMEPFHNTVLEAHLGIQYDTEPFINVEVICFSHTRWGYPMTKSVIG